MHKNLNRRHSPHKEASWNGRQCPFLAHTGHFTEVLPTSDPCV